jgi:Predicted transcriptional regulator
MKLTTRSEYGLLALVYLARHENEGFISVDTIAKAQGIPPKDGAELELAIGKNVLASRLGTVPETFSRTLKKLQDDGLIDVRGKRIRIVSAGDLFSILPH